MKKIAQLATGDELIHGDILNTNSSHIAHHLFSLGYALGTQMVCSDDVEDIKDALEILLKQHDGLIITGGLGPTSDDRTRYALAQYLQQDLVFDEQSWQHIKSLFARYDLNLTPSNRQQCLFPKGSTVLKNHNGTANGCLYQDRGKIIFMLPGPPSECLPMVEEYLAPHLTDAYKTQQQVLRWRLFGVAEGQIASLLEDALKEFKVQTGYRWQHPYIDFKLFLDPLDSRFETIKQRIDELTQPYSIRPLEEDASLALKRLSYHFTQPIHIIDTATGGLLQSAISSPLNYNKLQFNLPNHPAKSARIVITGLEEYWQQLDAQSTALQIEFDLPGLHCKNQHTLAYRKKRILGYAVEFIALQLYDVLKPYTK